MAARTLPRLNTSRVHLFRADDYDGGERWTTDDLDAVARNHGLLYRAGLWQPPVGIGHEERTAALAYGTVTRVWREGRDLYGSYGEVSPELERLLAGRYLRSRSVELYRCPTQANFKLDQVPGLRGPMLRRVVYLGAWPPRVKGLTPPSWAAGERSRLYCTRPGWTFAESLMDREHLMQVASQAGFGQQFLDGLDDNQLSGLVADLAGRMLGGGDAAGGTGGAPPPAEPDMDDMGDMGMGADTGAEDMTTPSRDQMISDLVAAGQEQQTLEQMDDASLKELWQQLTGSAGAAGAPPATYGERSQRRGKQVIQLTLPTLQKLVRAEARTAAAKAGAPDRHRKVVEFCEQMVAEGLLSPAQVERDAHGKPVGPVIKRLLRASPICFAEGVPSELEQQMAEVRQGPRVRSYGERLPAGPGGAVGAGGKDAAFEEKLRRHYDARLGRLGKG